MSPRLDPVLDPPLALADGGAAAQEDRDTLDAFDLATRLGATGIASGIRCSADGVAVVTRDRSYGRSRLRRRTPIAEAPLGDLPRSIATLEVVLERLDGATLVLDVDDAATLESALTTARAHQERHGVAVVDRLWLVHADLEALRRWRDEWPTIRLCADGRLQSFTVGPERWVADLAAAGIDAGRLPHPDWTGGLATLCHRFGVLAFVGPADHDHQLDDLLRMGVDAVSSPHVDRMVDALARARR